MSTGSAICCAIGAAFLLASHAHAATITVTSTADEISNNGNCTLREAILSANANAAVDDCEAGSGADIVEIPAGEIVLSITGRNEDAAATGDLDITSDVTIHGAGSASTVINGNALDRVFHISGPVTVALTDLTVTNGQVDSSGVTFTGGGVLSEDATTTIERSVITASHSNYGGGGVGGIDGDLTIRDTTVSSNHCNFGTGSIGCGIHWQSFAAVDQTLWIERSTITDNRNHAGQGFAVHVEAWGDGDTNAIIRNSTISQNVGAGGMIASSTGGIYVEDDPGGGTGMAFAGLHNVTITDNDDVGVYAFANVPTDALVHVYNSVIADNATYDCEGNVLSQGYNVVGDNVPPFLLTGRVCDFVQTGDQVVADAMLEPLADNGGFTPTQKPENGSPVIDSGSPATPGSGTGACEELDQRSATRFRCDVGAYDEGAPTGCAVVPETGCHAASKVVFQLRDKDADGPGDGDKMMWKWRELSTTTFADLGDPRVSADFSVCIYSGPGDAPVAGAYIPAAALCDGEPCWKAAGTTGYSFKDSDATYGGARGLKLQGDVDPGTVKARFKAQGANMQYSGLPLATDVTVQLVRHDVPVCWQSVHDAASVLQSDGEVFKSKVP